MAKVPGVKPGIAMAATLTCIQLLGLSAKATNQRLARHGLQLRNDRDEWELTEAGTAWAMARIF